jgi:hypothetical protein
MAKRSVFFEAAIGDIQRQIDDLERAKNILIMAEQSANKGATSDEKPKRGRPKRKGMPTDTANNNTQRSSNEA